MSLGFERLELGELEVEIVRTTSPHFRLEPLTHRIPSATHKLNSSHKSDNF